MVCTLEKKTLRRIYVLLGCILAWIIYTIIFAQIIRFDNTKTGDSNFDLKPEMYEIDQRVSVCFKDVVPYSILLKQDTEICRKSNDLLVTIHTHPSNLKSRNLFRKEFERMKSAAADFNLRVAMIFVLGLDQNLCISSLLLQEMSTQNDVLIGGFVDSFRNQTAKSITALRWFADSCHRTKLLLKLNDITDPSRSFDSGQLNLLIKNLLKKDIVLTGSTKLPSLQFRENNATFVEDHLHSNVHHYLHLNYLLSRNTVIRLMLAQANDIQMAPRQEDLYVTGVLASKARIRVEHDERFLKECQNVICAFCECPSSRRNFNSRNRSRKTGHQHFNLGVEDASTAKTTGDGYREWSTWLEQGTSDTTTTYHTTETTSTDGTSNPTWYTSELTTTDTTEYRTIYDGSTTFPGSTTAHSASTSANGFSTTTQFDSTYTTQYAETDLTSSPTNENYFTTNSETGTIIEPTTPHTDNIFNAKTAFEMQNPEKTTRRHSYATILEQSTFTNSETNTFTHTENYLFTTEMSAVSFIENSLVKKAAATATYDGTILTENLNTFTYVTTEADTPIV